MNELSFTARQVKEIADAELWEIVAHETRVATCTNELAALVLMNALNEAIESWAARDYQDRIVA